MARRKLHATVAAFLISAWLVPSCAMAGPVALSDERVVYTMDLGDEEFPDLSFVPTGFPRLSPDGKTLLYVHQATPESTTEPARLVIIPLSSLEAGRQRIEFRPDLGERKLHQMASIFSPDGKLLVTSLYEGAEPRGGVQPRPIALCELATGKVARAGFSLDLRYAAVDNSSKTLLYIDGESFSLTTGKRGRRYGYSGLVRAANPAAPIVLTDSGMEGRAGPRRVSAWNLRDNKLLAALPHNPKFESSADITPNWTSGGTHVYFTDAVGENFGPRGERTSVTRVWNVKTNQIVGEPLPQTKWRNPGPTAETMYLGVQSDNDERAHHVLHDAETGEMADLPISDAAFRDACGDKIAYVRSADGKYHVCVATIKWDRTGKQPASRNAATAPDKARPQTRGSSSTNG